MTPSMADQKGGQKTDVDVVDAADADVVNAFAASAQTSSYAGSLGTFLVMMVVICDQECSSGTGLVRATAKMVT